jgi:F-type H+-transporting ATPase subunit delta
MRGTSQAARDEVLRAFDPVATAAGKEGIALAEQLFAAVDALDGSGSLRRALTDPGRDGDDKASLVESLFGSYDARVVSVICDLARARWSEGSDLAAAIEAAGGLALLAVAQSTGVLHTVEEQLFLVERELTSSRDLLTALGDRSATAEGRLGILDSVLGGKVDAVTYALVARKVAAPRGYRLLNAVRELVNLAAERSNLMVASVTAAVELSAAQRKRLASILKETYGRDMQVNVAVDPEVLGGIKIQVGSEVVDGTVVARLADARRRLVG